MHWKSVTSNCVTSAKPDALNHTFKTPPAMMAAPAVGDTMLMDGATGGGMMVKAGERALRDGSSDGTVAVATKK